MILKVCRRVEELSVTFASNKNISLKMRHNNDMKNTCNKFNIRTRQISEYNINPRTFVEKIQAVVHVQLYGKWQNTDIVFNGSDFDELVWSCNKCVPSTGNIKGMTCGGLRGGFGVQPDC